LIADKIDHLIKRLQFQLWYYGNPPWDTGVPPPELQYFIQQHPVGRALDLGCGTGTNLLALEQAGWQTCGVDFAWRAVRIARRRLKENGFHADVRVGDVTDLREIRGPFDLILDIGCYHSLPFRSRSIYQQNLHRLLALGGVFMVYAHCKSEKWAADHGISSTDEEQFGAILRLIHKETGEDRNRGPSAWLTYRLERSN